MESNSNQNNQDNGKKQYPQLPEFFGKGPGRFILFFLLIIFLIPFITNLLVNIGGSNQISYTEFRNQLKRDNILQITISRDEIRGQFKTPAGGQSDFSPLGGTSTSFLTYLPSFGDDELLKLLEEKGVTINTKPADRVSFLNVLLNILPFLIFIWLGLSIYRNMRSQGQQIFSVGSNKAKLYHKEKTSTTLADVAGMEEVKNEIKEIIEYLRDPSRFHQLGAKTPKGVLLVGPPGTGKTLMARAVAGEANVPFYSMSGSDFMEMFVGVGAARVRNLFKDAKKNQPAMIFIDELDSVGRHRGAGLGGGHDEREQTLNQLLSEMDGFEKNESIIVFAATNRPDILDPALLRPGRFDRQVTIPLPTVKDREEILAVHSRTKPLSEDIKLSEIARITPGFSGADLENLLNEGALIAAKKQKKQIEKIDLTEARDKVTMGLERKSLKLTEEEKKIISYHEGGHALMAALLPNTDPIDKVTIIPRAHAMGVTIQMPERDQYLFRKEYLIDRIIVLLGGRVTEQLILHTSTSGAENDLKEATKLARKMVLDWGMSEKLKHMALGNERKNIFLGEEIGHQREYSEETAHEVDKEVSAILDSCYERAAELIKENREAVEKIAAGLQEKEELSGEEILSIIGKDGTGKKTGKRDEAGSA
ncbi:MAG: cell division protein FtsH [Spirochaetes bacterium]|nr:MAG: cell division protein FtsH [Spirochaetota bacterium]